MSAYTVKTSQHFWATLEPLKRKYDREQLIEIITVVKDCIAELEEHGYIEICGWDEHLLARPPYNDGAHFEFPIFDDDVLVVYFKRERNRVIRMVGIYDHGVLTRTFLAYGKRSDTHYLPACRSSRNEDTIR